MLNQLNISPSVPGNASPFQNSHEEDAAVACDWCAILEFDGGWANVEFVREKKGQRERRLIPLSSIRSITFLPEGEG